MSVKIKLLSENAKIPVRATEGSAGYDIRAFLDKPCTIAPSETVKIGTGFAIALEHGYAAFIYARSGLSVNKGIIPANCVGVIDSDYRGEVIVALKNLSESPYTVSHDDKIAQMVIVKCETTELTVCRELDDTPRGDGGFGSTGWA